MVYIWALLLGGLLYLIGAYIAGKFIKRILEWEILILIAVGYLVITLLVLHYLFVDRGASSEYVTKIALASAVGLFFGLRSRLFRWRF